MIWCCVYYECHKRVLYIKSQIIRTRVESGHGAPIRNTTHVCTKTSSISRLSRRFLYSLSFSSSTAPPACPSGARNYTVEEQLARKTLAVEITTGVNKKVKQYL